MLDRLLLISCICIVVALILYFFYWNRLLGLVLGLLVRLLYWNEEGSSIWVEIGSIHFSLLAGRILLKDVHYHSSNQSIKIVKGQLQWRYWIRKPLTEEEFNVKSDKSRDEIQASSCRIQITLQGFEWFLYNRTAAYDNIISQMEESLNRNHSRSTDRNRSGQRLNRLGSLRVPTTIQHAFSWFKQQLPILDPKDVLPLGIQVSKGVIICGNTSTPSLLVAEFSSCQGTFAVTQAKSRFDLYKQALTLSFRKALICMTENEQYIDPMSTLGELISDRIHQYQERDAPVDLSFRTFRRIWRQLSLYPLTLKYNRNRQRQRSFRATTASTGGKHRTVADEETPIGADFSTLEYAIERKLLETPLLELSYLVDVVGEVPPVEEQRYPDGYEYGNGDVAPDWALTLVIHGGILRYGPWADRQRADLQRIFFPSTYQNVEKTRHVEPGDKRIWTALQIFVELRDETFLHIPFREASKDWQWDGTVDVPKRSRRREPAFIEFTVGDRSSISYMMPMVASASGYEPVLEVHLDDLVIASSLNDIRPIVADSLRVHGDLPSPLKWNEERTWAFNIKLRQPVLFLLRDHINMFTDLGRDWASGPPSDWQRWVPTIYTVNLDLYHYRWNLYANDQNIIDKPLLREENALVTLRGERFETNVTIPSNKFRPESTTVEFQVKAPKLSIDFSLPRWNTRAAYMPEGCNLVKASTFNVKASYEFFSEVGNDFADNLILDFEISEVVYQAFGWSIRYWMVLRDNYLGSFTNYSTLYEYIDKRKRNIPHGDPINLKYRPNKNNMFQCTLSVFLKDAAIVFPAGLLGIEQSSASIDKKSGAGSCLVLKVPELQTHLRLHDYFLEMSLNTTSMFGYIDYHHSEKLSYPRTSSMNKIMMIDGLDLFANRLFGPVPKTTTYFCIWELNYGHIKLDMSFSDAQILIHAGKSFGLSFTDLANAPATEHMPQIDPDITFYKVNVKSLEIVLRAGRAAICLACRSGVKVDNNDVGGLHYSKSTGIRVPHVSINILLNASEERDTWLEAADLVTDVYVDIYAAPKNFKDFIEKQRAFVSEQDKPTDRAARLLSRLEQGRRKHLNGVYIPQPQLPNIKKRKKKKLRVVQPQPQSAFTALHLSRQSIVENIDSEDEELISEAERDARLAKTRTATPIRVREEEQAMSTGDESDDADLTDGESSDGDWSDTGAGGQPLTREESLLLYYARLANHYSSLPENRPGFWESSSFVLVKGRSSTFFPKVSPDAKSDIKKGLQTPVTMLPDPKYGSTTIRLQSRCISIIRVTPLIATVLTHIRNEVCSINLGPELLVDGFISSCLSSLSSDMKNEGKEGSHDIFLVSSPGINVSLLQNISMSSEGVPNTNYLKETHLPSKLDTTARINLNLKDIEFHGVFSQSHMNTKVILGELLLQLDTISGSRNLVSSTETFESCVTDLVVDFHSKQIHCSWDNFTTEVGQNGPGLVVATAIVLQQEISQVLKTLHDIKNHQTSVIQIVVSEILQRSENMTIIDPLSTIQPSYLIQEGIPHRLRTDPTFRFLFHLRNCLRNLHQENRNALMTAQGAPIHFPHFNTFLQSQFVSLDHDVEVLPALLRQLLDIKDNSDTTTTRSFKQTPLVSLDLKKTCLRILGPVTSSANELSLSGIKGQARMNALDLIRHTFNNPASMSQTSFREKGPHNVKKISAQVAVDDIHFTVYSHLLVFIQHVLQVRRIYLVQTQTSPTEPMSMILDDKHSSVKISSSLHVDATVCLRNVQLQAAAANLIFEVGIEGLTSAVSFSLNPDKLEQSLNTSILFTKLYLKARTPLVDKARQGPDQDILATFNSTGGKANTLMRSDPTLRKTTKVVFSLDGLHLIVPRSALRLYRFFEEWQADFLPGIQSTFIAVLSELHDPPNKPSSSATSTHSSSRKPLLQINGKVNQIGMLLQVMHGTWLSWEVNGVVAYVQSSPIPPSPSKITFGLQIASTVLEVSTRDKMQEAIPTSRVNLTFPALSLGGDYDGRSVQTLIIIDFLDLKVKPSHWDTLLVVQQKFGQDFNDFVLLMQNSRRKSSFKSRDSTKSGLKIGGFLKMHGFRIGFEGFSSTMFLECQDIGGGLHSENGGSWDIGLTDLALSLAPRSAEAFQRESRSVFVVIDVKVIAGRRKVLPYEQTLELAITKVHAVMQPSSIGEMGDFIDYLQAEVLDRKEQRALELAAFKQKTQSIMKTFEVKTQDIDSERPWLSKYLINVTIKDLGIAFPISLDHDIPLPKSKSKDLPIKAFLFSISSVTFAINRSETGEAVMNDFSFQFVPQFRQSNPADFTGTTHQSRNRLIYPEMKAQLRSALQPNSRQIWINANVSGFILDLDSTITDYVFSLIDVYRQGKDRLEQLSNNVPRTPSVSTGDPPKPISEEHYNSASATNVFASLTFLSGEVRMHRKATEEIYGRRDSRRSVDLSNEQRRVSEVEIFRLPVVSVWAEYRAFPAKERVQEASILMFRSTVHSSRNTLRPTLLPFLTELVNNIETRMRKASSQAVQIPVPTRSGSPVSVSKTDGLNAVSSMRISFSLRIDRSRLEFTCKPDVNVVAGLNWESGGFIINMSPGAKQVVFTGAVEGLSIGLKHGFLSEDCVQLDARNLSFSFSLSKDAFSEDSINLISVVLDTEFHGKVKFSRLQDILCFKAVWLDLFPLFNSQSNGEVRVPLKSSTNVALTPQSTKQTFQSVFLIRVRQVNLEVDLGHSISKVNLTLTEAVMRTKLTDALNEVSIRVGELLIVAEGNLSGRVRVPDCFFQTIRRSNIQSLSLDNVGGRMLELKLTSGPLVASLESDRQRLLHYHAEPLEIEVFDDWTSSIMTDNAEQPIRLSFIVTSPGIVAAVTIGTIPKLMSYANKFEANLKAQREGASRESATFRNALSLKPNNHLSAVAEAILETAKTKHQETENNPSYTIQQFMSLQLDSLRLVVFPRSMEDTEIAHFVSKDVKAQLDRFVATELSPLRRDLHLSFSSMTISKYTLNQPFNRPRPGAEDGRAWLEGFVGAAAEAIVVGLPSMMMHMSSKEIVEDVKKLVYDFNSNFIRQGMKDFDDIYITLNVSLYSWLTVLRKNLTREMDQVRATAEWRTSINPGVVSPVGEKRRQPLDLSTPYVSPKSMTLPPALPITAPSANLGQPLRSTSTIVSVHDSILSPLEQTTPAPFLTRRDSDPPNTTGTMSNKRADIKYEPNRRSIERLTMRQLGEATPDVMHPFFMKKAGFNLEDSLPQYVNEYATTPLEEIMEVLLKLYSRQVKANKKSTMEDG